MQYTININGIGEHDASKESPISPEGGLEMSKCGSLYTEVERFIEQNNWNLTDFGVIGINWDMAIRFDGLHTKDTAHRILNARFQKSIDSGLLSLS